MVSANVDGIKQVAGETDHASQMVLNASETVHFETNRLDSATENFLKAARTV